MAFQIKYDDQYGLNHPESYARIARIHYECAGGQPIEVSFDSSRS